MKTKLTLLLAALAVGGMAPSAMAGPDLQTQELRRQIAESHYESRTAFAGQGGTVTYLASPSGKGGTTMRKDDATTVALFKSHKMKAKGCDDAACCAKAKSHNH